MEPQNPSSNVDTSRPFRSVKEAVAIFGERRLLIGFKPLHSPPPPPLPLPPSPQPPPLSPVLLINKPQIKNSTECEEVAEDEVDQEIEYGGGGGRDDEGKIKDDGGFGEGLKKLEAELAETKKELRLLKEREAETEVAVAALNAELHKSMSRLAMAEASAAAAKAATPTRSLAVDLEMGSMEGGDSRTMNIINNNRSPINIVVRASEEKKHYPRLSEILSVGDQMNKKKLKKNKMMMKKQKPIVPLVGDLVSPSISSWKRSRASNNATLC